MVCSSCGAAARIDQAFCTSCGAPRGAPQEVASAASAPRCAQCSADLIESHAFCVNCGLAVGGPTSTGGADGSPRPLPPAPVPVNLAKPDLPALPPKPSDQLQGGRRGWALVGVGVVVAAILVGVGFVLAMSLSSDEPTASSAQATETPDTESNDPGDDQQRDPDESSSATSPTPTSQATVQPSPTPSADDKTIRCWDGMSSADVAGCSTPTGVAGLRWVVPGFAFAEENCDMRSVRLAATHRHHYNCPYDGTDNVRFNFSEFDSPEWGVRYHDDRAGTSSYPQGEFLRWDYLTGSGEYKTALLYRNGRWGVTIYSYDQDLRDETAANLLDRFRPEADLRGVSG